jgi:hypothetical protein
MRKIVLLAAMIAALGKTSQAAGAHDRGFSFRHFSGHAGPKLHLRDRGRNFHHGGLFGQRRPFKPRHFGDFNHGGLVLRFGDGDVVLKLVRLFPSNLVASDMDTAKAASSSGSIARGTSGTCTTAASLSKTRIDDASGTFARASRVPRPARVAGWTAPRRQMFFSDNSSSLGLGMCRSFCTRTAAEYRPHFLAACDGDHRPPRRGRRTAVVPGATNAASISGQSMPSGLGGSLRFAHVSSDVFDLE